MDINELTKDFTAVYRFNFETDKHELKPIEKNPMINQEMWFLNCIKAILDGMVANELVLEVHRIVNIEGLSSQEKERQINELTDFVDSKAFDPFHFEFKNGGNDIPVSCETNGLMLCEYQQDTYSFVFYKIDLDDLKTRDMFALNAERKQIAKMNPLFKIGFEYKNDLIRFYGEELSGYTTGGHSIH